MTVLVYYFYLGFRICYKPERKGIVIMRRWIDQVAWNGAIQTFNEIYLCLCFSVFFNFYSGISMDDFSTKGLIVNSSVAIVSGLSLVMVPAGCLYVLQQYWCKCIDEIIEVKTRHKDTYNYLKEVQTYEDLEILAVANVIEHQELRKKREAYEK